MSLNKGQRIKQQIKKILAKSQNSIYNVKRVVDPKLQNLTYRTFRAMIEIDQDLQGKP